MSAPDDDEPITAEETRLIVGNGQLGVMAQRLARHRHYTSLGSLLERLPGLTVALRALTDAMRLLLAALRDEPERRRGERLSVSAREALRTIRMLAGEALVERVRLPALTDVERTALGVAGGAFVDAGDLVRGALTFQSAGDWASAADAWGRLGDLDAMESCLARDDEQRRQRRSAAGTIREIASLMMAGERREALRLADSIPNGTDDAAAARRVADDISARLVRGRGLTLRHLLGAGASPWGEPPGPGGQAQAQAHGHGHGQTPTRLRLAGVPARLGRDASGEIVLRDPGVSRQHARIEATGGGLELMDAGSRLCVFVAGARIERPFPLTGDCAIALGPSCPLLLHVSAPGRVELRGVAGLDRGLVAVVASGRLGLEGLLPGAAGAWLEFSEHGVHLGHAPGITVRLDGHPAAHRVDLLRGDLLELEREEIGLELDQTSRDAFAATPALARTIHLEVE
jgi:hypothetical protein